MAYIFDLQSAPLDAPFVGVFDVETVEFALGYDVDVEIVVLMSVKRVVMTRQQIVKMTSKTASLVASNKAGVAPRSQKHVARLEVLKAAAAQKTGNVLVRKKG
jgi:hypothetical protein